MFKNICIILLSIVVFSFGGCTTIEIPLGEEVHKLYYSNGILKSIWLTEDGHLSGIKREYTEDGILKSATEYRDDVVHGMKNIYYADGSLWVKEAYRKGKRISQIKFNEEGFVVEREDYK